ncbi:MAG: polysaccharide deacetylase family protein [Pirellulales bacterium]|nr:polysaccharide deacetylase family protein [Pirellulales bacterium]
MNGLDDFTRRRFLLQSGAAAASLGALGAVRALAADAPPLAAEDDSTRGRALVAITLDLEMSRNFPRWEDTHWDYEKGNLDEPTKAYALAAAKRVAEFGGRIHFFVVGRVLEQENIDWLLELKRAGHPLGNHTYDHVNVTATTADQVQFRFQRAPWLVAGRPPQEIIAENVRLCAAAMKSRLDVVPAGFRTPGGFHAALTEQPAVQAMLLEQGYPWVSSQYVAHDMPAAGERPGAAAYASIEAAQARSQPFVYDSGLVEVPMSPVSDVTAFRAGRWTLDEFLLGISRGLAWCLEHGAVYDFLAHPSCLCVADPQMKAIDFICRATQAAGDRAQFADLELLARRGLANGRRTA